MILNGMEIILLMLWDTKEKEKEKQPDLFSLDKIC